MTKNLTRFALVAAAGALIVSGPATAAEPLRVTKPVQITTEDVNPTRTYNAPNLLADPSNPDNVVGSYADFRTGRCNLVRSTNGGQSWKLLTDSSPMPGAYPFCQQNNSNIFHGYLAFGRDGTLYYAIPGWDTQDRLAGSGGNFSVIVARSDDLGDTWEQTIVRNARGKVGEEIENNRPVTAMVVDTKTGSQDIVYVTYQRGLPGKTAPNAEPTRVFTAISTDGGVTFGEPIEMTADAWTSEAVRAEALKIAPTVTTIPPSGVSTTTTTTPAAGSRAAQPNQVANFGGRNPTSAIDDKGNVYILWHTATSNITPGPPVGYFMTKTTDGGKTWTTNPVAPVDRRNGFGARIAWSPEGGSNGTLHFVAMGNEDPNIAGYGTIYYRQSTDNGATWTDRKLLPDIPAQQLKGQYIPNLAIASNGRVDVAWWDTRDDPGNRSNDVYYTYSEDNGQTWSKNVRISDQSINRTYGVWGVNYDMSSPPGMASTNELAVFGWDDTRFTDPAQIDGTSLGGGTSDMFSAAVQFEPLSEGTSSTAKIILAAVIGLLVVGIGLLLYALITRRRGGAPPKAKRPTTKTAAGVS